MVNKGSLQDYDIAVATDVDISAKCAATSFDKRIIVSASHSSIDHLPFKRPSMWDWHVLVGFA